MIILKDDQTLEIHDRVTVKYIGEDPKHDKKVEGEAQIVAKNTWGTKNWITLRFAVRPWKYLSLPYDSKLHIITPLQVKEQEAN
jgi:hypothetical protein